MCALDLARSRDTSAARRVETWGSDARVMHALQRAAADQGALIKADVRHLTGRV